jgi:hypothetical protein
MRVRRQTWLIAAWFLIVFCWLGFFISKFSPIFQGVEQDLPITDKLVVIYGPLTFPLLGFVSVAAFVLSDVRFTNRWARWSLVVVFSVIILWAFKTLVTPRFGVLKEKTEASPSP